MIRHYILRSIAIVTVMGLMTAAVLHQAKLTGIFGGKQSIETAASLQKMTLPVYSVEREDNKCSITFDCAWGADDIPDIIRTLKEENIKTTFFLVGTWAQKNPELVRLMLREGHDVSCHGYTHLRFTKLDKGRVRNELTDFNELIAGISGQKEWSGFDLFRAPYGEWDEGVVTLAGEEGFKTIQWDCDSLDWKPGITSETILERIDSKISRGGIILLHNSTPNTSRILKDIIKLVKSKDLEPVKISELIYHNGFTIDADGRQKQD